MMVVLGGPGAGSSRQEIPAFARRLHMAARKRGKPGTTGTLIRGEDGALYFVPDGKNWARRLPDKLTKEARDLLDEEGFVAKSRELPAFHASGLVKKGPEGIDLNLNRLAALGIGRRKLRSK